jgi:hypothetical protein
MSKNELIAMITELRMDDELRGLIIELIEGAESVNDLLLDTIADILEMQAEFYENAAEILMDESEEYETLEEQLKTLDKQETAQKLEATIQEQEALLSVLDKKIAEFKMNQVKNDLQPNDNFPKQEPISDNNSTFVSDNEKLAEAQGISPMQKLAQDPSLTQEQPTVSEAASPADQPAISPTANEKVANLAVNTQEPVLTILSTPDPSNTVE